jgi:hypothetical protein
MRNTADVTGGKPIAVLLQSISGVSAINPISASDAYFTEISLFKTYNSSKHNFLMTHFVHLRVSFS